MEPIMWLEGWNFQIHHLSPTVHLQERERAWRFSSIINSQWCNWLRLSNEVSINLTMTGFGELQGWWTCRGSRREWKLCIHSHVTCPTPLSYGCSRIVSFIIKESYSKYNASLSSVNCSRQLLNFKEKTVGTSHLQWVSQKQRWKSELAIGVWGSGWGWTLHFCRTEPLTCGTWHYSTGSVRMNCLVL